MCIYSELGGRQGGEEDVGGGVVAKSLAEVGEAVDVAGAEDERAAQLEGIEAEFVLVVAGGAGALAVFEIVASEEMENVGGFEIGDFVGLALLVDEQGEVDAGFLQEDAGVVGVAEADGGEGGVPFAEGWLVFAQLRDVLAAEDSAVMAKEDEDGGIRFPERAEAELLSEGVGQRDAGESLAEGFGHDGNN
jgi:hypothetical protein